MYPSKSTYDYMTEINRLFPRNTENDVFRSSNTISNPNLCSPFRQTTPINRSSSSAESMSPDSFPDMSHRSDIDRQVNETPFIFRRQRPIIGRKIFDNPDRIPPVTEPTYKRYDHDIEFPNTIWQPDTEHHLFPPTPPSIHEQKNIFYELFPTEKRGFEFKPPVPSSPVSTYKPVSPNYSSTLLATPNSTKVLPPRIPTSPFRVPSQPNYGPCSSKHQDTKPAKMCTFCRKNGETPLVYMTHSVRENVGSQSIVTCPILRSHVCSTCGASGDQAHTITYCPVLRSSNNGRPLQSTTITLKNTRIKSNGHSGFVMLPDEAKAHRSTSERASRWRDQVSTSKCITLNCLYYIMYYLYPKRDICTSKGTESMSTLHLDVKVAGFSGSATGNRGSLDILSVPLEVQMSRLGYK